MRSEATGSARLPSIIGLRGAAVLCVMANHLIAYTQPPDLVVTLGSYAFPGRFGVVAFFVVSGFIITHLLLKERDRTGRVDLPAFYARRFVRLLPAQMTLLLAIAVLSATTRLNVDACNFVTAVVYVKNYACRSTIDLHLWTLSVYEQFFLFWPLALLTLPRRFLWAVIALGVASAPVFRAAFYVTGHRDAAFLSLPANMDAILFGCVAALLYAGEPRWLSIGTRIEALVARHPALIRLGGPIAVYALNALKLNCWCAWFTFPFGPTVQSAAVTLILLSLLRAPRGVLHGVLNSRLVTGIGTISYSLYLWHQLVMVGGMELGFFGSSALVLPVAVGVVFAISGLSYLFLEKPFAGLRARLDRSEHPEWSRARAFWIVPRASPIH